jgi:Protein of unknown function (DUF1488)
MTIEFPNASRTYDATRRCVRFSGYDGAIEKFFFLEQEALGQLAGSGPNGVGTLLDTFDQPRDRICNIARRAYEIGPARSYTLRAADFS